MLLLITLFGFALASPSLEATHETAQFGPGPYGPRPYGPIPYGPRPYGPRPYGARPYGPYRPYGPRPLPYGPRRFPPPYGYPRAIPVPAYGSPGLRDPLDDGPGKQAGKRLGLTLTG
jgi:hypothetical protein